jgi:gliding motility-associated-like protein/uncharacterized repeat protein (TIGR01451 family)
MRKALRIDIMTDLKVSYLLALLFLVFISFNVKAEGSKDLYPATQTKGSRAFLYCNTNTQHISSWPFKTTGTHYVYAVNGETIAVGSSAQGVNGGYIKVTSPDGDVYTTTIGSKTAGYIIDRDAELAGPYNGSGAVGKMFRPYDVSVNKTGVWRVDFYAPGGITGDGLFDVPKDLGLEKWDQTKVNINVIAAWDVSVRNGLDWYKGRVYTNVLNLLVNSDSFTSNKSYYATHYILTKDGRAYRVQTNGNNGVGFTFFSNSNGFAVNSVPTYRSLNGSEPNDIIQYVHDPRSLDDGKNVTHKIFYNKPNKDLPASAPLHVTGNPTYSTWLKNAAVLPEISNIKVIGKEGTVGQVSNKGANITFTSSSIGTYRITIPVPSGADRVIIGVASFGANTVFWDGKDGNGVFIPAGTPVGQIKTKLQSAEVHFPYIDMEINPQGIIIELTDNTLDYNLKTLSTDEGEYSDRVYWDDTGVDKVGPGIPDPFSNAVEGRSSRVNGHKWGTYVDNAASTSFGNARSIDTWAYIQGSEESQAIDMVIKTADLMIESIRTDVSKYYSDQELTYTIRVKNDGPSAVEDALFNFRTPVGFVINTISYTVPSGTAVVKNTNPTLESYLSLLNLSDQAVVEFVITGKVNATLFNQLLSVEASILRPADVTDPDATNPNSAKPVDPHSECFNGTGVENCNNIKYNTLNPQEVCLNGEIIPIEYTFSLGGTSGKIIGSISPLVKNENPLNKTLTVTGTYNASGIYSFILGTQGSEKETTTAVIKVNPLPAIVNQPQTTSVCVGQIAVFTIKSASTDTYQWQYEEANVWKNFTDVGNITGSTTSTINISAVPLTYNGKRIRVIVSSVSGCSTTSNVVILRVNALPDTILAISGSNEICEGESTILRSDIKNAISYQWYLGGQIIVGANKFSYTASEAGVYTVAVGNEFGCFGSQSVPHSLVIVPFPDVPNITHSDLIVCAGNKVKLTSDPAARYQWRKNGINIPGATLQEYLAEESGDYSVAVINAGDCEESSMRVTVVISPVPAVPIISIENGQLAFCDGGSVELTSSASTGNQWYKDGGLINGATSQKYVATASGIYTVRFTDGNGCYTVSAGVTVVENQLPPVPTVTVDADLLTFCDGGSVELTSSSNTGNQWYKDGGLITGAINQKYVATESGVYTVRFTDANGCYTVSAGVTVVENTLPPVPTITVDADLLTFCDGGSVELTSSSSTGNQWYKDGGLISGAINQKYVATESGVYTVRFTDGNGCYTVSAGVTVVENTLPPVPTITVDADLLTFCDGGSVELTSSVSAGNQWYKDGGLITGASAQKYVATESGIYTVRFTDANGCYTVSAGVTVVENQLPPVPTITVDADLLTFCDGGSVELTSSSAVGNQWYKDGGLISGATGQKYVATESGVYTVRFTDGNGCYTVSAGVTVVENTLPPVPTVTVDADLLTFCDGGSVELTSSSAAGNQWYKDGGLISGATDQKYVATESGVYTVRFTDANGCYTVSAGVTVVENTLPPVPTITVDADLLTFCDGGSVELTSSSAVGNQWYKDGSLISGAINQKYVATESGVYTVRFTDGNGCYTVSAGVTVVENLLPPVPTITVDADLLTFCDGGSVELTSSSAAGNQWYKDGGLISGATDQKYVATESGVYTVRFTDANGCYTVSAGITVVENLLPPVPTITVDADLLTFCDGGSVELTSSASTGNQWYKDGGLITGAINQKYVATESGVYTVRFTDANGCYTVSAGVTVVENPLPPVPTITVDADLLTFCDGGSVELTSSSATGNQWYKDGSLISGAINQKYVATEFGVYTVRFTDANGCYTVSAGVTVVENPLPPVPTITVDADLLTFCDGGSVELTSSSAVGNQWYKDGSLISGAINQKYVATASGVYTVRFTDGNGCYTVSAGVTVVENQLPPVPTITVDADLLTFCDGGSVELTSSSTAGNQWYKDGGLINGATNQKYVATESGVYTVRFTDANGCYTVSAGVTVVENPLPPVPTITVDADLLTFCDGGSVELTSSSAVGNQWYKDGSLISGATGQKYVATASGVYTVRFTDGNGCYTVSAGVTVVENTLPPVPTVTVDADLLTFCDGGSVELTSSSSTGNQWYKDGSLISGATGQKYVATASGVYTVRFTDGNGCYTVSTGVTVVENTLPPVPTVTVDADLLTFCDGGSVELTSSSAAGNQWYKDGGLISGATGQKYVATESGVYTVRFTDANGCYTVSAGVTVVENTLPPVPTITVDADLLTFCDGGSVELTSSASAGNQWYKDGGLITGATGQKYVATASGVYTVRFTDGNGCYTVSAGVTVVENQLPPVPTITVDADLLTFCDGGSVELTSSSAAGNQWYKDGGLISGATGQKYVATESGVYTVRFTDGNGCYTVSAGVTVVENQLPPVPTITVDADLLTFCDGGSVELTSSSAAVNQWYKDGSLISGAINQKYVATESGVYTVRFTDANGCYTVSAGVTVVENPLPPVPTITVDADLLTFCDGGSVELTSSSAVGNQWYKDGGLITGATGQKYVATASGVYTVRFTDANGCYTVSAGVTVVENQLPPVPKITVDADLLTFCDGGSVELTSSASTGNQWYKDGGLISGATGQKYVATASGVYTVRFTDGNGCYTVSAGVTVVENPLPPVPTITVDADLLTFCDGGSVELSSSATTGNQWYKDGGLITGATAQKYVATESGVYTVRFTDANGCYTISAGVTVVENQLPPVPTITVDADLLTFCDGGSVELTSSASTGNQWYKDGGLITGATAQKYVATESGVYTVRFTDANGCYTVSAGVTVVENQLPPVPKITVDADLLTFCDGGSVELTSSSAAGNQWYKDGGLISGATGQKYVATESGVYTVRFTDANGCYTVSAGVTVVENTLPPVPTITVDADLLTFCDGGSVELTSSSAVGNQWYKDGSLISGATGQKYVATESGVYTVRFTDANGCYTVSAGVTVVENQLPPVPTITVDADLLTFCDGGSVELTSSASTGNQWYKDGGLITGATGQKYVAAESGVYTVRFTDANGCYTVSAGVTVVENTLPPVPTITVDADLLTFCDGGSVELTSSSAAGNQWYKDGGLISGATGQKYVATESGVYTVRFTDANGCYTVSAGVTVVENQLPPVPTITVDADLLTFCDGGSVELTSSSAAGNQWYKDGSLISGAINQKYVATESGVYTVRFTDANGCYTVSAGVTVVENTLPPVPTITVDADLLTFCDGGSVELSSSASTGNQWYKDGGLITGATAQKYVATESGVYTVRFTDGNGCYTVSAGVTVVENQLPPVPTITVDADLLTFCDGGSVELTSSASTGNQWYKDGGLINGATNQKYVATESGVYTVRFTDANGCYTVSAGVTVVENQLPPVPTITVDADLLTFCDGGSVELTSSASTGNQWYKDGGLITGATGQKYVATESGVYTVRFTDVNECYTVSAGVTVVENQLPPVPTITVDADLLTFCDGGSVELTSSSSTGNQWYKDGGLITGATGQKYVATESGVYTVRFTDANGCYTVSAGVTVVENQLPQNPTIIVNADDLTFCEGSSVILTSSSANGNQWYRNGNLIVGATNKTLEVNAAGNYAVKVTNESGCSSEISESVTVIINKIPKGYDDQINTLSCSQSSFIYNLQDNVNNIAKGGNAIPARFSWTVSSTNVIGATSGLGSDISATLINTSAVAQNVVYTVIPISETGDCSGTPFTITVQVPACINLSITKTADKNVVSEVGDKITYTITVYNNGNASHTQVEVNDEMFGGILNQPTGDNGNGILEKGESWVYKRTYTITQNDLDNKGIPAIGSGKISNIVKVKSLELPSPTEDRVDVDIQNNPSISLVKTGKMDRDFKTVTYIFKIKNTGNVTLNDLVLTDLKFTEPIRLKQTTLAPGESITETLKYTFTEEEKVAGTTTNTATVTGYTIPRKEVTDISGTTELNDDPTVVSLIRYPIAVDDYGTTKMDEEVVLPIVNNDRPALFPLNTESVEVLSQPSNGRIVVDKDGKVTYKPNKGFFGSDRFTYKIQDMNELPSNPAQVNLYIPPPPLEIPNTFTPNGDGKNDNFLIKGLENYEGVSLFVYNRWGDEVYRNNNYKNEWDGNGLNDGTYFYVLKLRKGKVEDTRRSWVLIKR